MDMNDGVRRKNATRESTNTLKAWLQEHKKNPYPTKGEKIMLAIITKMTLTQVMKLILLPKKLRSEVVAMRHVFVQNSLSTNQVNKLLFFLMLRFF